MLRLNLTQPKGLNVRKGGELVGLALEALTGI
jgi:hypothetical protein